MQYRWKNNIMGRLSGRYVNVISPVFSFVRLCLAIRYLCMEAAIQISKGVMKLKSINRANLIDKIGTSVQLSQ